VQKYESGVSVTDLANMYSMSKSTISKILQREDLYKEASVAKCVTQISTSRSTVFLVNYAHYTNLFYYEKFR
jgi:predicted transcriptional regulator